MSFTPVSLLVGIILILGALALFFLDKIRPGYARDTDKVYAVLLLISGVLSLGHLTAGVTESFQLMLMTGMLFTLVLESIRNREPMIEPTNNRMDNRPPRPRYDERPPSRRVYRAELDERADPRREQAYPPRMAPSQDPRIAPIRDEYRRNEYDVASRPRQPYEEYRGPAGRLQPSSDGARDSRYTDSRHTDSRHTDSNGRYGERPPVRPPTGRPPMPPSGNMPGERFADRGSDRGPNNFQSRPPERNLERYPAQRPPTGDPIDERPNNRERPANGERALNVRPYSEAPKLDLPREGSRREDYRPTNPPEGAPSEQ